MVKPPAELVLSVLSVMYPVHYTTLARKLALQQLVVQPNSELSDASIKPPADLLHAEPDSV